jgi:hypothetical protein
MQNHFGDSRFSGRLDMLLRRAERQQPGGLRKICCKNKILNDNVKYASLIIIVEGVRIV